MRRRLFNLASALSLLLLVATVALWVGSFWWELGIVYHADPGSYEGRSGWLTIARSRFHFSVNWSDDLSRSVDTIPKWSLSREPVEKSDDEESLLGWLGPSVE
jgi:hypothetical protein